MSEGKEGSVAVRGGGGKDHYTWYTTSTRTNENNSTGTQTQSTTLLPHFK